MKLLQSSHTSIRNAGWLMVFCYIGMTFIPRSFDSELFMDGLAYAAISRNMAFGQGNFWEPYFAESFWLPFNHCVFFCEHPPLMFGLQSLLFKVLGDTTAVENIYNGIILVANIGLIVLIWEELFEQNKTLKEQSWLPVFFWYGFSIVWWSAPNNLLDSTMTVFCLLSCYFQSKAIYNEKLKVLFWIISGTMIVLSFMTKGPVGTYPIAFTAIYYLVGDRGLYRTAIKGTFIITSVFIFFIFLVNLYSPAKYFLGNYFQGQVMAALFQQREKVSDDWTAHFHLIRVLLSNIFPHLLFSACLLGASFYFKLRPTLSDHAKKVCYLTLLVSASVILPMLISVKQGDHYLLPALPFVALFFAAYTIQLVMSLILEFPAFARAAFVTLSAASLMIMGYSLLHPKTSRMFDVSTRISRYAPPGSKIYLPAEISDSPEIQTSFQRYGRLSIAYDPKVTEYLFFDDPKNAMLDSVRRTGEYQIVDLGPDAMLAIHR